MEDEINGKGDVGIQGMARAFVQSANRCRYIILVIVFTSILVFIAFWNSQQNSWITCRMRIARYALEHDCLLLSKLDPNSVDALLHVLRGRNISSDLMGPDSLLKLLTLDTSIVRAVGLADIDTSREDRRRFAVSLLRTDPDSLEHAIGLCRNRGFASKNELEKYSEDLQRLDVERVSPFFRSGSRLHRFILICFARLF